MNNKGFTLIEVLATIVILAVIMGIAANGVLKSMETAKIKSERIFVDKLATAVQSYLSINGSKIDAASTKGTFEKCRIDSEETCDDKYKTTATLYELETITITTLTSNDYRTIEEKDIVNPRTKENCLLNSKDPTIRIFRDSDFVYYYYMDLRGTKTSCNILDENAISTNLPKNVCAVISGSTYTEGKCILS